MDLITAGVAGLGIGLGLVIGAVVARYLGRYLRNGNGPDR